MATWEQNVVAGGIDPVTSVLIRGGETHREGPEKMDAAQAKSAEVLTAPRSLQRGPAPPTPDSGRRTVGVHIAVG